jgi:hypothetical protein
MLIWLLRGEAHLNHEFLRRINIDVETLPYNRSPLEWIKQEKRSGRLTILATASNSLRPRHCFAPESVRYGLRQRQTNQSIP